LREKVLENEVRLEHVSTKDQIADIFTKELPKDNFEYLLENVWFIAPPFN
jgi:hypothetical protein